MIELGRKELGAVDEVAMDREKVTRAYPDKKTNYRLQGEREGGFGFEHESELKQPHYLMAFVERDLDRELER